MVCGGDQHRRVARQALHGLIGAAAGALLRRTPADLAIAHGALEKLIAGELFACRSAKHDIANAFAALKRSYDALQHGYSIDFDERLAGGVGGRHQWVIGAPVSREDDGGEFGGSH